MLDKKRYKNGIKNDKTIPFTGNSLKKTHQIHENSGMPLNRSFLRNQRKLTPELVNLTAKPSSPNSALIFNQLQVT